MTATGSPIHISAISARRFLVRRRLRRKATSGDVVHDNGACHPGRLAPLMFPAVTVSRDRSVLLVAELFYPVPPHYIPLLYQRPI